MNDIDVEVLYERTRGAMDVYEDDDTAELDELFPDNRGGSLRAVGLR